MELEVRMRVSAEFFLRVLTWFSKAYAHVNTVVTDDFFYTVKGQAVRTSRTIAPHPTLSHVIKTRLASEDVTVEPSAGQESLKKGIDYCDLRVSLNEEKGVPCTLPVGVDADLIRRKERTTFMFHKFWKLDATKVYSGSTLAQVEHKQQHGECEYELELECVDLETMLSEKTDDYIAEDAMLKSTALFSFGSFVSSRGGK
jgi:hypothetical protein